MSFKMPVYTAPDFSQQAYKDMPNACWIPAPANGVAPDDYHATTIFPEYFKINGSWQLARESRMDCVAVLSRGVIEVKEFRRLKKGDLVAVGRSEDGSNGIYVHATAFTQPESQGEKSFAFRQGRSRETAYAMDYDSIYDLLRYEKEHGGHITWVLGPACCFDWDARHAFAKLVHGGYVQAVLAGNALATHDLEAGYRSTALGRISIPRFLSRAGTTTTSTPSTRCARLARSKNSLLSKTSRTASWPPAYSARCRMY